jgi:hypothetical protein
MENVIICLEISRGVGVTTLDGRRRWDFETSDVDHSSGAATRGHHRA